MARTAVVSLGDETQTKTCHIGCRGMASILYVSSGVSLGHQTQRKTRHIGCMGMAFLRYVSSCVTRIREKIVTLIPYFPFHIDCKGMVFLQYVS
jgi:hypothetical protein